MKKFLALGWLFFVAQFSVNAQATSLSLPFFDDFARFDGHLDPTNWENEGGTYVNNVFSQNPLTKNIVTFNGFSSGGSLNSDKSTVYGVVDTLTSKPINLSGYSSPDSVYLSFYLQTGGLGDVPISKPSGPAIYFQILFKDNTGAWQPIKKIDAPSSGNISSNFQYYLIRITEAKYFHGNFQFRFRTIGNNQEARDTWNLDYVKLNANRRVADPQIDVATSRKPQSILKRYEAMPIHQFNANTSGELNDSIFTTLNNLENSVRNIPNFTSIKVGNNIPVISMPQTLALPPLARQFKTTAYRPVPAPFNGLSGFQDIKATVFITSPETNNETRYNDTISRITALHNYYAFDDGSLENLISVSNIGTGTGQIAHKFLLNQNDMVNAISVYLSKAGNSPGTQVYFRVWKIDGAGNPDNMNYVQVPFTVPALSQLDNWVTIPVNPPVAVSGGFFIGWSNARTLTFSVGLDKNETRKGIIYFTPPYASSWSTFNTNPGALMLRAVMNNNITGLKSTVAANPGEQINVYPNPAADHVMLAGSFETVSVRSATGQLVRQVAGQTGETRLELNGLAAGLYILQFQTKTGNITRKLIINPNR